MTEQELREKIEQRLISKRGLSIYAAAIEASYILALIKENYVRLAADQGLPENTYRASLHEQWRAYDEAQQDMKDKGWRKVEL